MSLALSGIASGRELDDLAGTSRRCIPRTTPFPARCCSSLLTDAIEESGATRATPLATEGIRRRLLPEDRARTRAPHDKADFALRAAAIVRGGVDPALLDEAAWWREDDLWFWSLEALVVSVRAASEHSGATPAEICERIGRRHAVELGSPS